VWTAPEEPAPLDTADVSPALPAPGWLLHATAADGIVRLVNHGTDRLPPPPAEAEDSPHYAKFAYSSATAPQTPPGPDNHIALLAGEGPSRRGRIHPLYAEGRAAASWHAPLGSRITTTSVVHGPWEVRIHRVEAPAGAVVRIGGWAIADDTAPRRRSAEPAGRWPGVRTD
jgi:hypothetical protein